MCFRKIQAFEETDGFEGFFGGLLGIEAQVFQQHVLAASIFSEAQVTISAR